MNPRDERHIVTIVLRCAAILTILVGLILVTQTIVSLIAASSASSNLPPGVNVNFKGTVGKIGAWAIIGQVLICVWGAILFAFARPLADAVVADLHAGAPPSVGNSG
ncbi:MAG: hypothetical protein JW993_07745 [Sedimentisphaerales bacterium]|nr:hypothetical protein [Sedimentisphaerales bacterium]